MQHQGDDLVRAVAAEPDDDAVRLVFSDWLEEHAEDDGDRAFAAFIRAQVALAGMDEADPAYPAALAAVRRAGVFTGPRRRPWLDHVPGGRVKFRRGFVAGVEIDPRRHVGQGDEWQRVPAEELFWNGTPDYATADALTRREELARVRTLRLEGWPVTSLAPVLTGSPYLAGLRALRLSLKRTGAEVEAEERRLEAGEYVGPRREHPALAGLARSLALPALDSLHVEADWYPTEWQTLVTACRSPLRRIHLATRAEDDDWGERFDLGWFDETDHVPAYGVAWVDLNTVSWGSHDHLAPLGSTLGWSERVESLGINPGVFQDWQYMGSWGDLRQVYLPYDEAAWPLGWIAHAKAAGQLVSLALPGLYGAEARQFAAGAALTSLRRLSVHGSDPTCLGGEYVRRLHRLDWGHRDDDIDVSAVVVTDLPELRWLTLRGCDKVARLARLATVHRWPNLCTLLLPEIVPSGNSKLEPFLQSLAAAPGLPHLSLVGVGRWYDRQWWVLGDGRATAVDPGVDPIADDGWVDDPVEGWH